MSASAALLPWLGLAALAAVSAALIAMGWRGRRIGHAPFCRACGFELSGIDRGARCPECGQALNESQAVAVGRRQRRTGLLIVGGVLGILVLAGTAAFVAGLRVGVPSQPTSALIWQVRFGVSTGSTSDGREQIAAELMARRSAGEISDAQLASLLDAVLDGREHQAVVWIATGWSPTRSRVSAWDDLLGEAYAAKLLTPEQRTRCVQSAVAGDWVWFWSRRRLVGASLSFQEPMPKEPRLVPNAEILLASEPLRAWIDGEPVELPDAEEWTRYAPPGETAPVYHVPVNFFSLQMTTGRRVASRRGAPIPPVAPLSAGDHTVQIDWRVRGWLVPLKTSESRSLCLEDLGPADASFELTHEYAIRVVEDPAQVLTFVRDPAREPRFVIPAGGAAPAWKVAPGGGDGLVVAGQLFNINRQRSAAEHVWVVGRPFLRAGGQTAALVEPGRGKDQSRFFNQPYLPSVQLSGHYPFDRRYSRVTLVLVPDPEAAANWDVVGLLWAEPIEIPIELDWSAVPEDQLPPEP